MNEEKFLKNRNLLLCCIQLFVTCVTVVAFLDIHFRLCAVQDHYIVDRSRARSKRSNDGVNENSADEISDNVFVDSVSKVKVVILLQKKKSMQKYFQLVDERF